MKRDLLVLKIISKTIFFGLPALITYIQLLIFSLVSGLISTASGIPQNISDILTLFHEPLFTFPITMVLYVFNLVWLNLRILKTSIPMQEEEIH